MTDDFAGKDSGLVKVIFIDNSAGLVKAGSLDQLIAIGKIAAFYRSDGWVKLGRDPVRGMGGSYKGPERRKSARNNPESIFLKNR
jgi:hypothetical protein